MPFSLEKTAFAFLDETGVLPAPHERYFGVGMIKCAEPAIIQRPMQIMRNREHIWTELKWSALTKNHLPVYKTALQCFRGCPNAQFACFIADKTTDDPIARFGSHWAAYERLATQLIVGNIGPDEHMVVLADEYSTPGHVTFEENLRRLVQQRLNRNALVGVCRMRSTGVDVFQILDLLLGAVQYEYRQAAGEIPRNPNNPRGQLLAYIQNLFGVTSLVGAPRSFRLNVAEYRNP